MRLASIWLFLALVLVPVLHAELLSWVRGQAQARFLATAGASAAFLLACVLSGSYFAAEGAPIFAQLSWGRSGHAAHFAVDSLNAPLLPLLTLLTLALVIGGSAVFSSHRELRALLWLESLSLLTISTSDLLVLAIGFAVVLIPAYRLMVAGEDPALRRVYSLYHGAGLIALLGAWAALSYWMEPEGPFRISLWHLDSAAVPESARPVLFGLLCCAALVRMGVAPFHSWLPPSLERGSLYAVTLLVSIRTGFYVLARLALPAFPHAAHAAMPILTVVALFSAFYGAVAALGQHDLRRMVGFFVVSQSGIMLTGLLFGDPHAVSGTLLYWLGFAIATTGLLLMIASLAARTGSADMRAFGGLVRALPHLSACFFLFGLATIAIPGTVAFVAEDMLVHGALEKHPLFTFVMIVAMVLNAITFMRAFAMTFLGQARGREATFGSLVDLLPRERVVAVALLLALIVSGVLPGPIVDAQAEAAKAIAFARHLDD
jgi:NADH-quinone oxidoreductase subunit M